MAKFTEHELTFLETSPDALRSVADYNDLKESESDAMGESSCAEHHKARRHELTREAERIEAGWNAGGESPQSDGGAEHE